MQRIKKGDLEIKSRKICSVPKCSTYGNSIISLHKFPSNPKAAQKWRMILKIEKPISKFMFVCSKHFVKDDFFSVTSTTQRKRLKDGSVPSQNLPVFKYQHSIIKKEKSDRSWLRQKSNKQVGVYLSRECDERFTLHLDENEHDYAMETGKSFTLNKKTSYHTALTHVFSEDKSTNTDLSDSFKLPQILNRDKKLMHFTGKPARLEDQDDIDWAPSQNMGYQSESVCGHLLDHGRKGKRKKILAESSRTTPPIDVEIKCEEHEDWTEIQTSTTACLENQYDIDWVPSQNKGNQSENDRKGVSSKRKTILTDNRRTTLPIEEEDEPDIVSDDIIQTHITKEEPATTFDLVLKNIGALDKVEERSSFGLMDEKTNNDKWKYYTSFKHEIVYYVIFPLVNKYISSTTTSDLSSFNQLLLTLIKLHLDLDFQDLAYRFEVSLINSLIYFKNVIDILYKKLRSLIVWPERSVCQKNMPSFFKKAFQNKNVIILDCFEICIEKPDLILTPQRCWSYYKHNRTIKYLIGISSQGTVSFISDAWGGQTSDKQLVKVSNFCNHLNPEDVVLVRKRFVLEDKIELTEDNLQSIIPACIKGKHQLHPLELEKTVHLDKVQIYVQQMINAIKNNYNVLNGTIPVSMLEKDDNENNNMLDKIVVVCSALVNLSPPDIPLV